MGSTNNSPGPATWATDHEPTHDVPKAEYPRASTKPIPTEVAEIKAIAQKFLDDLNDILSSKKYNKFTELMNTGTSFWRDHLGLTNTRLTTLSSGTEVASFIEANGCMIESFALDQEPLVTGIDPAATVKCIQSFVTFNSKIGTGRGLLRLVRDVDDEDSWKIYTAYTVLWELDGFSEKNVTGENRPLFGMPEDAPSHQNWKEYVEAKQNFTDEEPAVLIVGAGHSGIITAARLGMFGIKTLIIDTQDRAGDSWRKRYHHLFLHDSCYMNTMPYLPYPANFPVYLSKDKMAAFLEYYISALELNLWTKTSIVESKWHEEKKHWTVVLESSRTGQVVRSTHHPRHIVQATGLNGPPLMPSLPGMDRFKGSIIHSSQFSGATAEQASRKFIVVGTGSSGHDIAQDAYQNGAKVTMVQRSTTYVMTLKSLSTMFSARYNEHTPTADSDLMTVATPMSLVKRIGNDLGSMIWGKDITTLCSLQKAGFSLPDPADLPSLLYLSQGRGGGFYIDTGCSAIIASGGIKMHQGRKISHLTETSIVFTDGSEIEADEIVFATGYANGKTRTRRIFGDAVADRIETIWGMDHEGEQRGVWKRSGHPGFWVAAGNYWLSRHYSRLLALQIKAIEEGISEL